MFVRKRRRRDSIRKPDTIDRILSSHSSLNPNEGSHEASMVISFRRSICPAPALLGVCTADSPDRPGVTAGQNEGAVRPVACGRHRNVKSEFSER
jgi:hypothetical protein